MVALEMWELYSTKENISADYEAWAFGDDADKLANLVLDGIKTGTSSLYYWYVVENEELPREGEYSVILDSKGDAVCVIKNTKVYVVPFSEVSEHHAWKEGEGDRSLSYWRETHQSFFTEELVRVGLPFDTTMDVVCEEFEIVFSGKCSWE